MERQSRKGGRCWEEGEVCFADMLCAAPVASYEVVWNGAASGGAMVTITGMNFGSYGFTATANAAFDADCGTTSWSSATTVACTLSAATSLTTSYLKVTVGAVVGTRATKAFTFDGARVGMWLEGAGPSLLVLPLRCGGMPLLLV